MGEHAPQTFYNQFPYKSCDVTPLSGKSLRTCARLRIPRDHLTVFTDFTRIQVNSSCRATSALERAESATHVSNREPADFASDSFRLMRFGLQTAPVTQEQSAAQFTFVLEQTRAAGGQRIRSLRRLPLVVDAGVKGQYVPVSSHGRSVRVKRCRTIEAALGGIRFRI